MRILLKSQKSGWYYVKGHWTPDPADAQDFESGMGAIQCALAQQLTEMEVIYDFPNPAFNHVIPILLDKVA